MLKKLFKIIGGSLASKHLYLAKSLQYFDKKDLFLDINLDYVRYRTLELCMSEIKKKDIHGNMAEVGVYKGSFSEKLNKIFPDRKLYLFDTFEGFDAQDVAVEKENNYSTGDQDFSDTSVAFVLSRMKNKENCIVRKGFFPATAEGLEDKFCFVSLDADLYQPILSGLEYFYPRLEKGGYIFIHDFNNQQYGGARDAVIKFCSANGVGFVPIPDNGGTAIISK